MQIYKDFILEMGENKMNRTLILILFLLITNGCRGLNRLVNGEEAKDLPETGSMITSIADISATPPEFNLPMPLGYNQRLVFHGALTKIGIVQIHQTTDTIVKVFVKQRNFPTLPWFIIGTQYSDAYYYHFDKVSGRVTYYGDHLDLIEYCVYQYTK